MVGIRVADGNYYLTSLDVKLSAHEFLINPELLNIHLTAFFHFCLIFSSLLGFYFHSRARTSVFVFYLRTHSPSLAEVIAYVQADVRQVETAVALVVGI